MSREQKEHASGGIGFVGLLQVALIVLKLCKVIEWNWFMVFVPIWGTSALVVAVLLLLLFCAAIGAALEKREK